MSSCHSESDRIIEGFTQLNSGRSVGSLVPSVVMDASLVSQKRHSLAPLSSSLQLAHRFRNWNNKSSIEQFVLDNCIGYRLSLEEASHFTFKYCRDTKGSDHFPKGCFIHVENDGIEAINRFEIFCL